MGHSATFAYNAGDLLTSTTDRNGKVRNLSYDALNRKTGETWVVSGSTVNTQTFTYDAADNQLTAQDQSGAYTMAYDTLNRMTSEQEPFGQVLTFSYDAASNRTQVNDSQSGVTTSVYDALGRLTSRKFSNGTTNLRIDPGWTNRDQLASLKRYTDLGGSSLVGMSSYTYDAAERLTALTHTYASGSVLASYAYGYDQASRLTSETVNGTQTTYAYDNTDQLTTVNGVATYSYDLNGNRTMTGYSTGTGNELKNDGTFTYTYDSEGNLTQKSKGANLETWYYGYDSLNRMTSVRKTSDGTTNQVTATYTYDVFGNRIEQDEWVKPGSGSGVTTVTRFAYDGGNVWADLNSSNALTMRRLYLDGMDQPFARVDSNNVAAWYLTDHLGSVRDVMDKAGATDLDQVVYDAYGNISSESAPTSGDRYKYTGREWDGNTGLQYNRARYYDPKIGRWTSQDLIGFDGGDPNLYRYVSDVPTDANDPTGTIAWKLWYTDSYAPEGGDFGAFAWGIKWALKPKNEAQNGFIIQRIKIGFDVAEVTITGQVITMKPLKPAWTTAGKLKQPLDYLEAWQVVDGKIIPAASTFPDWKIAQKSGLFKDGEPPAANDWWVKPSAAEGDKRNMTDGHIVMEGWAYYFDKLNLTDLGYVPGGKINLGFGQGHNDGLGYFNPCGILYWLALDSNSIPRVKLGLGAKNDPNRSEGVKRRLDAFWAWKGALPPTTTTVKTTAGSISGGFWDEPPIDLSQPSAWGVQPEPHIPLAPLRPLPPSGPWWEGLKPGGALPGDDY